MNLTLPAKFLQVLSNNQRYEAETKRLLSDFSDWVKDNKLEFFPEYTDHGIEHIQSVLNTSEEIINPGSWELLTPEDILVLVSAILLHDCAMHIDKLGLWSLLKHDKYNGAVLSGLDKLTWEDKWYKFKKSVSKFEESDWISFFGEYKSVNLPDIDEKNLDDYQKIIIGDFVRQHHAKIAEVIATYGIPSGGDEPYEIFNSDFTSLNQLAGFVARSHNYDLRSMVDELGGEHRARSYQNTHPAFLMGVLRIADYLQFEQERTPKILFKLKGKGMCSPISLHEWQKHLAILNSNKNHSDTELLFVEALPENAKTLQGIKKLFSGFQSELDSFWAVTGEIYSRYENLSALGINLRRIKSNIDEPENYIEQHHKQFYPEVLKIQSDNQKILPLLIAPLYGDIPQVGLRELIQNSVDACNERYSSDIKDLVNLEDIPYEINVTIDLDTNTLIIQDEGVGMDVEVVKDYFLKIGASYRHTEVWKANHSDSDTVFVPRTGKFGIGMLAGFLIGDQITVHSKKVDVADDKAVFFTYALNESNIEVIYKNKKFVGTEIIIDSNSKRLEKLIRGFYPHENETAREIKSKSSFWYYLDTPRINIKIIENDKTNKVINPDIIKKQDLSLDWNSVLGTSLEGFYWKNSLAEDSYNFSQLLFCNGIEIRGNPNPVFEIDFGLGIYRSNKLDILVFDNKGQFPLNLTRNGFVTKKFFELEKLKESVYKYYFKEIKEVLKTYVNFMDNVPRIIREYFRFKVSRGCSGQAKLDSKI